MSEEDTIGCLLLKSESGQFDMFFGVKMQLEARSSVPAADENVVWHKAAFTGIKTIKNGVSPALTMHAHCEVVVDLNPKIGYPDVGGNIDVNQHNVLAYEALYLASLWHAESLQTVVGDTMAVPTSSASFLDASRRDALDLHFTEIMKSTHRDVQSYRVDRGVPKAAGFKRSSTTKRQSSRRQSRRKSTMRRLTERGVIGLAKRYAHYKPPLYAPLNSMESITNCLGDIKRFESPYVTLVVNKDDPRKAEKYTADLVGKFIEELHDGNMSFIKKIDMSEMSDLGDVLVARLATVVHYVDGLESLILPRCGIGAEGCAFLAKYMASLSSLKHFDLSDNYFGAAMPRALLDIGSQNKCPLVSLKIDGVNLTYRGVGALVVLLNSCETLEELHICRNSLGMESALKDSSSQNNRAIKGTVAATRAANDDEDGAGTSYGANEVEEAKDQEEEGISERVCRQLADSFGAAKKLRKVYCGNNLLGPRFAKPLTAVLLSSSTITHMDIGSGNNLRLSGVNTLIDAFWRANDLPLEYFGLSEPTVPTSVMLDLALSFGNLDRMRRIDLGRSLRVGNGDDNKKEEGEKECRSFFDKPMGFLASKIFISNLPVYVEAFKGEECVRRKERTA